MKEFTKAIEATLSFYSKLKQDNPEEKTLLQSAEDIAINSLVMAKREFEKCQTQS